MTSQLENSGKIVFRRIRSFVRREGRITTAQQAAIDELLPRYGLHFQKQTIDFERVFLRDAPCFLEIGFGNGASLLHLAQQHPENNYLGIDVHRPGVGNLLQQIEKNKLNNIRVMCVDAIDVLQSMIPDNSLSGVFLFFPDPWHKTRHHKRRIVQTAFIQTIHNKLLLKGIFHMATDWENYAQQMMRLMSATAGFENSAGKKNYCKAPDYRVLTKFEKRGQALGHAVWDILFKKI